jgi:2-isopropylmalate synthase
VFDEDLVAILYDEIHSGPDACHLEYLHVYSGTFAIPTATARLRIRGQVREAASIGDGPVDAVYKAISTVTKTSATLVRYDVRGVTSGTEAMAEATVHLEYSGRRAAGRGASTDVIEASAKAYVDALNRLGLPGVEADTTTGSVAVGAA